MDTGDEEDQMAAMMGFSSFAAPAESMASKKRKLEALTTETGEPARPPVAKGAAAHNSNYMPLGQPKERKKSEPVDQQEEGSLAPRSNFGARPLLSKRLEELSDDDLYALRKGVPDGEGSIVYFQKSFIDPKPWSRLEIQKG